MSGNWIQKGFKYGILIVGIFSLVSYLVMYLWNWLLPDLIGASAIGFWQAAGLLLLSRLLFGGFGKHKSKHWSGKSMSWKEKMQHKWANMSEEDKEKFKSKMEKSCPQSWKEGFEKQEEPKEPTSSS